MICCILLQLEIRTCLVSSETKQQIHIFGTWCGLLVIMLLNLTTVFAKSLSKLSFLKLLNLSCVICIIKISPWSVALVDIEHVTSKLHYYTINDLATNNRTGLMYTFLFSYSLVNPISQSINPNHLSYLCTSIMNLSTNSV